MLWLAWPGLFAWFTPDDLMNLHGVVFLHPSQILAGRERPTANLVLKGLWELFGLHPRPYRVFCFGLLLANLWLALRLFFTSSLSWKTALFAGLFFSYHAQLQDLYFNSGTIYDLLCFFFFFSAMLVYLKGMDEAGFSPGRTALTAALAALAAGSKEIAVSLPVLLGLAAWTERAGRAAWRAAALAALVCWAVLAWTLWRAPMSANPAYQPDFRLAVLNARWKLLTGDLLYRGPDWPAAAAWVVLAAAVLAAFVLRRRAAWLALGLIVVTPLPLLFLPQRSFYAFYVPYAGWCLLAGLLLDRLLTWAAPRSWLAPLLAAAALAVLLAPQHRWLSAWIREHVYAPWERKVVAPGNVLRRQLPPLPPGSAIYFVDDPLPPPGEEPHVLAFLCRLKARDPQLAVWRARNPGQQANEADWSRFAAVFRLTDTELVKIR
ncbi:MAG: hypothetical protein KatS3mg004_3648 [Bryobacteraceae bacterium]|nr:MAG: hypothetical protein KatS3mg004_3648 [Bryobacteraceae bacterium]